MVCRTNTIGADIQKLWKLWKPHDLKRTSGIVDNASADHPFTVAWIEADAWMMEGCSRSQSVSHCGGHDAQCNIA